MTFGDSMKIKKKKLAIKEQSCRVLFKDYYYANTLLWAFVPFDESFLS